VRIKTTAVLVWLAVLLAAGCSRPADTNSAGAESRTATENETRIDLTAEQARAGAEARVTIPERRQTVTVKIPPGVRDGMTLRLRGQGALRPDGTPGDFLIKLRVR
jgi:hypothetical protein